MFVGRAVKAFKVGRVHFDRELVEINGTLRRDFVTAFTLF